MRLLLPGPASITAALGAPGSHAPAVRPALQGPRDIAVSTGARRSALRFAGYFASCCSPAMRPALVLLSYPAHTAAVWQLILLLEWVIDGAEHVCRRKCQHLAGTRSQEGGPHCSLVSMSFRAAEPSKLLSGQALSWSLSQRAAF